MPTARDLVLSHGEFVLRLGPVVQPSDTDAAAVRISFVRLSKTSVEDIARRLRELPGVTGLKTGPG